MTSEELAILRYGQKNGMFPYPDGYREDGSPVYFSDSFAKFFGMSEEELLLDSHIPFLNEDKVFSRH